RESAEGVHRRHDLLRHREGSRGAHRQDGRETETDREGEAEPAPGRPRRPGRQRSMKFVGLLLSCALGAFAAGETIYIHGADVYPVSAPMMKNVSVLIENGKITDVGPKVVAPKGARTI